MRIRVKRLVPGLPLPQYHSAAAAAFDLFARESVAVPPGEVRLVPTGLVMEVPEGHALLVVARSSLPIRKHLMVANGVGVVDADYRGPADEIHVEVYNFSTDVARIDRGERLAQGLIVQVAHADWEEVTDSSAPSRGGFGSTGGYR
jgi:dUTP pyrophosphatase